MKWVEISSFSVLTSQEFLVLIFAIPVTVVKDEYMIFAWQGIKKKNELLHLLT